MGQFKTLFDNESRRHDIDVMTRLLIAKVPIELRAQIIWVEVRYWPAVNNTRSSSSFTEVYKICRNVSGRPCDRTSLRAADISCVGSHLNPLSTNTFLEALSEGVCGPDGRSCSHRSSEHATVRRAPPRMHPFRST